MASSRANFTFLLLSFSAGILRRTQSINYLQSVSFETHTKESLLIHTSFTTVLVTDSDPFLLGANKLTFYLVQ